MTRHSVRISLVALAVVLLSLAAGCSSPGKPIAQSAVNNIESLTLRGETLTVEDRDLGTATASSTTKGLCGLGFEGPVRFFMGDGTMLGIYTKSHVAQASEKLAAFETYSCSTDVMRTQVVASGGTPVRWAVDHTQTRSALDPDGEWLQGWVSVALQIDNLVVTVFPDDSVTPDAVYVTDVANAIQSALGREQFPTPSAAAKPTPTLPPETGPSSQPADVPSPTHVGQPVDGFTNNDGSTICEFYKNPAEVQCIVLNNKWSPQPQPPGATCSRELWNRAISLRAGQAAAMECPHPSMDGPSGYPPLAEGHTLTVGSLSCANRGNNLIVCEELGTPHAFGVSPEHHEEAGA